ncbi:MAG: Rieske (2Fe-2S) protein [Calditrichaceae bacterium]|jgi:nitrite reductase (NADH) small subunit
MAGYIKVAESNQVKDRFAISVIIRDKKIAIFRYNGNLYALRDSCPHQAAPISDGYVDDGYAVCPNHGWRFRLEDGSYTLNGLMKIPTYEVTERNGNIFIRFD